MQEHIVHKLDVLFTKQGECTLENEFLNKNKLQNEIKTALYGLSNAIHEWARYYITLSAIMEGLNIVKEHREAVRSRASGTESRADAGNGDSQQLAPTVATST